MKKILLPLALIALLVAACVPSVNPFYTDKDVLSDPNLVGTWKGGEDKDKPVFWNFELATNRAYAVALTDDEGKTGKFEGHLFHLDAEKFLDLTPTECNYATNQTSILGVAMIPGHLLLRIQLADAKINLAFCDPGWVKKFLQAHPAAVGHRDYEDGVVLTAETPALQQFVRAHLGQDELFSDGADYLRQTNSAVK